ncbi:MAG: hypothetical protein RL204_493 [Bacteroidota bacterium]|jgi:uncharacterized repeat protein (TIGR01451 family)
MKKLLLLILFVTISSISQAQEYFGDVEFFEQIQVDDFVSFNPGITTINGNLFITNILETLDLSGLSSISTINGTLYCTGNFDQNMIDFSNQIITVQELQIQVTQLADAQVFINLSNVPIAGIDVTTSTLTFPAVTSIEYLYNTVENASGAVEFPNCNNLQRLHIRAQPNFNFPALTYISYIHVEDFDESIISIDGLETVTSLDSLVIFNTPYLETIGGLQSIEIINNYFKIEASSIQDISPISNITFAEELTFIDCNNLQTLPVFSNNPTINYLNILSNLNLSNIDGLQSASIGNYLMIYANPNLSSCNISAVCSFLESTPDESLIALNGPDCSSAPIIIAQCNAENEISGNVFIDDNCDGVINGSDYILENETIEAMFSPVENTLVYYSNQYNVFAPSNAIVTLNAHMHQGYTNPSITLNPTEIPTIFENTNLSLCPIENYNNLSISITNTNVVSPGFQTHYIISISNTGSLVESGIGSVTFDSPFLEEIISTSLGSINGNIIQFETMSIDPLTSLTIELDCQISPSAALGAIFTASAEVTSQIQSEPDLYDNSATCESIIIGSFDPNNKIVNHPTIHLNDINPTQEVELIYTVNFQNTGTAPAINIRVEDLIAQNLNLGTFEMIASSHANTYTISNNQIIWYFDDIMLPDSNSNEPESHGWFSFKISKFADHLEGDVVENQVSIFFDFNEPIVTNIATTSFVDCLDFISISGSTETCINEEINLSIMDDNFTFVQWSINDENVSEGLLFSHLFTEAGTYSVAVHAENANCIYDEIVTVTINSNPEIILTYNEPVITANVTASSYQWYFEGELIEGAVEATYEATQSGNYSIIASTEAACPSEGSINVIVCPDPPTIIGPSEVCGMAVAMFSTPDNNYPIINWYFEDVFIASASEVPMAFANAGEYNIILEVGDENCTTTSSILVTAYEVPEVEIFNMDNTLFTQVIADTYQWYLNGNPIEGATESVYNPTEPGIYSLFVVFESGCENESNAINYTIGVDELNSIALTVYPNPFEQTINLIATENASLPLQIELYDIIGNKVYSNKSYQKNNQLDVATIARGAYLCRIIDADGKISSTILEKK